MRFTHSYLPLCMMLLTLSCTAQEQHKHMNTTKNPLLCDPEAGFCEMPGDSQSANGPLIQTHVPKPIAITYFTDPICSSCWGIEPQLRRLKLEYGSMVQVNYHMGGLLPDWSYNSGGISKPSDVAHHWDEVSAYYRMPIDGDVWLEDPLPSSYPPSIAFKAAQLQHPEKAVRFLRIMREQVFLQKKNITKWENLRVAAVAANLNPEQLKADMEQKGKTNFEDDLALARKLGVRGFPTLIISNGQAQEVIYGFRPYSQFESTLHKLAPTLKAENYSTDWQTLFTTYPTLTLREFAELSKQADETAQLFLNQLVQEKKLAVLATKNGNLYQLVKP